MVIKDYLYRAKNMLDFIESARSGVPCDKSTSRTRIFHWGTVSAEHLEALLAFLPSDECGIRTLELGGDCGIGPEGAARSVSPAFSDFRCRVFGPFSGIPPHFPPVFFECIDGSTRH